MSAVMEMKCDGCGKTPEVFGSRWCATCYYPGIDRDYPAPARLPLKDTQIMFNAAMVRAVLDLRKTQTRRMVKLPHENPLGQWEPMDMGGPNGGRTRRGQTLPLQQVIWHTRTGDSLMCPYGQPGDTLWGRENGWERPVRTERDMREGADTWAPYYYDADGLSDQDRENFKRWGFKRRPSIHMPRWASRITLEVTEVRVQRLQDISEDDAIAEGVAGSLGVYKPTEDHPVHYAYAVGAYRALWEIINGPGSWDWNPWVWAVTFKQREKK